MNIITIRLHKNVFIFSSSIICDIKLGTLLAASSTSTVMWFGHPQYGTQFYIVDTKSKGKTFPQFDCCTITVNFYIGILENDALFALANTHTLNRIKTKQKP